MRLDVAMDQEAADFFKTSYDEFITDGGKVEGIVEWIGDATEAEKVCLLLLPICDPHSP